MDMRLFRTLQRFLPPSTPRVTRAPRLFHKIALNPYIINFTTPIQPLSQQRREPQSISGSRIKLRV